MVHGRARQLRNTHLTASLAARKVWFAKSRLGGRIRDDKKRHEMEDAVERASSGDDQIRKEALLQLDRFQASISDEWLEQVRNFDPGKSDGFISLMDAALLPFVDQANPYR